eukprot:TRINITY_DN41879_c0_g1_i1.p1 TRINITY_DN41879_c0_g1~~TRINITY_DN41879_c0_g1_i1.p1  ORF type:complete len:539 (-),score=97.74 TRINITY_DN41879_c0_g1_i1:116-1732(-)
MWLNENMWRRKSTTDHHAHAPYGPALRRALGVAGLWFYGVGATIGSGVFVLTGEIISDYAGPAAVFSYLLAGVACLLSCLCYCEFASRVPFSGSAYTYAYVSLGELAAWIVGWDLTLEYGIGAAAVARGFSSYMTELVSRVFSYDIPTWLYDLGDNSYSPISSALCLSLSIVVALGINESSWFNNVLVALNVSVLIFFVVFGSFHVNVDNWSDFFPYGVDGVLKGSGLLFIAFLGFDAVTTMSEESVNPSRDIPIAAVGALCTAGVVYFLVALILSGIVSYSELDSNSALATVFYDLGYNWAGNLIAFCAVTSCVSCTLCSLMAQPRIYYRMSSDGLLSPVFRKVNECSRTPLISVFVTAVLSALFAFFFTLEELSTMISIGTLICFSIVCISILTVRYKSMALLPWLVLYLVVCVVFSILVNYGFYSFSLIPAGLLIIVGFGMSRLPQFHEGNVAHFLVPLFPAVPLAGLACNSVVLGTMESWAWLRFGVWLVIGLFVYVFYGYKHSALNSQNALPTSVLIEATAPSEELSSSTMST